jgi:dephospho-CoA kinase
MIILGLTGSIGMGKSTVARMLRRLGVPVFDADAEVHRLQAPGGAALQALSQVFPDAVKNRVLDRALLRKTVFGNAQALQLLESILHPLVRTAQQRWLQQQRRMRKALVVLDVPLLFERGGWTQVDATLVVSAPLHVQVARVLARPGMSREALAAILRFQMPDADKRRRADYVIHSGLGYQRALRDVRQALSCARRLKARRLSPRNKPK